MIHSAIGTVIGMAIGTAIGMAPGAGAITLTDISAFHIGATTLITSVIARIITDIGTTTAGTAVMSL